jgi:tartrate dehydratase alpha subunit/fumarate hydratase class I-like protein
MPVQHPVVSPEVCEERHQNLSDRLAKIEEKLDEIHKLLVGNGHMGLCGKIAVLWNVSVCLVTMAAAQVFIWIKEFFT